VRARSSTRVSPAEYHDGIAEQLARDLTDLGDKKLRYAHMASWEFLWFDPAIAPRKLETLPLAAHFSDQGLVTARSDWGPDATFFSFKCGAPGGRSQFDHARAEYPHVTYLDVGHDHPDQNSFTLYGRGTYWLDDAGYDKPKLTANHNTVLVDGVGQIGEGKTWFSPPDFTLLTEDRTARIVLYRDTGRYVEAVGEAARCYPASLGLKKFTRRALLLRPDLVLVHDELAADGPRRFDYVLHRYDSGFAVSGEWIVSRADNHRGEIAVLVLAPAAGLWTTETFTTTVRSGTPPLHGIKLHPKSAAANARFVTLLCLLEEGENRPRATLAEDEKGLGVTVAKQACWTITLPDDPKTPAMVSFSAPDCP
jgi:hypothetical protein